MRIPLVARRPAQLAYRNNFTQRNYKLLLVVILYDARN
jgi:hypothetical protein